MASESNPNRGAQVLRLQAALADSQGLARRVIDPLAPAPMPEAEGEGGRTRPASGRSSFTVRVHIIEPKA